MAGVTRKEAKQLNNKAYEIRQDILKLAGHAREGHCAPALSIADIMTVLYFHRLKVDPREPDHPERDRFVLSKGHACLTLYVCLYHAGFIDRDTLYTYLQPGTELAGHPVRGRTPGVEVSSGSLGHGMAVAAGMALAAKMDGHQYHTFTLIGDGESNEGMVWETALIASHRELDNLTVIMDRNRYQCDGYSGVILKLDPVDEKWRSFGWEVQECNGHDVEQLAQLLDEVPFRPGRPSFIVAHTIKGKGVEFMENRDEWHYRTPLDDELTRALKVLRNLNDECPV